MKKKYGLKVFELSKALEWVIVFIMIVILIITTANVFARYVFRAPIFWTDELNLTLFVWLVFIGTAVAVKHQEHMNIDFFMSFLKKKMQSIIALIINILIVTTIIFILIGGFYMTLMSAAQSSPSLPVSRIWSFIPIPISCMVMIYYEIKQIIGIVKTLLLKMRG